MSPTPYTRLDNREASMHGPAPERPGIHAASNRIFRRSVSVTDGREAEGRSSESRSSVGIFISYRRDDSEDATGRLYDALAARFGANRVFMDVDTIPLGLDFERVIRDAVSACDVFVAVIGKQWLTITDSNGVRRLDNPEDLVRLEIKAALERDLRVIPVLVQGAEVPASQHLPADIAALARRNGITLRGAMWRASVKQLIDAIEEVVPGQGIMSDDEAAATSTPARVRAARSRWGWQTVPEWLVLAIAVALVAVGAVAGLIVVTRGSSTPHGRGTASETRPGTSSSRAGVSAVSFTLTGHRPTVTVNGQDLGTHPPTAYPASNTQCGHYPDNGNWYGANGLWFRDNTHPWIAGRGDATGGSCIGIIVDSWSDDQVTFRFGHAYAYHGYSHWWIAPGDAFTIMIKGQSRSGVVKFH
jgi:hypothetical protein